VTAEPSHFDTLSRDELCARAQALGVKRPELLTRVELRDEIIRLTETDAGQRKRARGWFGVARDLVASVVEQGLNLPDAAEMIRGAGLTTTKIGPPVATVTLAEIYAAQGHHERALALLDQVLANEPDHRAAALTRERLVREKEAKRPDGGDLASPEPDGGREALEAEQPEFEEEQAVPPPSGEALCPVEAPIARDVLLLVRAPTGQSWASWELTERSFSSVTEGSWCLVVVEIAPSWDGPTERRHEVPLDRAIGQQQLEVAPSRIVRAALGTKRGELFIPKVLAAHFGCGDGTSPEVLYVPPGHASADELALLGARAFERTRRLCQSA